MQDNRSQSIRRRRGIVALAWVVALSLFPSAAVLAQVPVPLKTYADLTGNGAAQALAGSGSCSQIQFVALRTNSADLRLGDANVSATQGIPVEPGGADMMSLPMATSLSSLYFYAANGDKLSMTCLR